MMNFNERSFGFLTEHEELFPYYDEEETSPEDEKFILIKYKAFNPYLLKSLELGVQSKIESLKLDLY